MVRIFNKKNLTVKLVQTISYQTVFRTDSITKNRKVRLYLFLRIKLRLKLPGISIFLKKLLNNGCCMIAKYSLQYMLFQIGFQESLFVP